MSFVLTEDQEALRATIERAFADLCTSSLLRSLRSDPAAVKKVWSLVETLGLFEYFSDASASLSDLASVAYEAGKVLMPGFLVDALYWGPFSTSRYGDFAALLAEKGITPEALSAGRQRVAAGFQDGSETSFIGDFEASAIIAIQRLDKGKRISVQKPARLAPHDCLDLTRPCFSAPFDRSSEMGPEMAAHMLFDYMILVAAELSGIAAKAVLLTRDYVLTRKQFGVPVGAFQAVQQQMADAYLKTEAAWALTQFAVNVSRIDRGQLPLAARSALVFAATNIPLVLECAMQLHGGIGFTWEYDLHLYLRRARTLASLFALGHDDVQAILSDAAA